MGWSWSKGKEPSQELDQSTASATSTMAPSRPSRDVKLTVPRFNSKKVNSKLAKEIASVAKQEKVKVDVKQTVDPTTALALSIVSHPL